MNAYSDNIRRRQQRCYPCQWSTDTDGVECEPSHQPRAAVEREGCVLSTYVQYLPERSKYIHTHPLSRFPQSFAQEGEKDKEEERYSFGVMSDAGFPLPF